MTTNRQKNATPANRSSVPAPGMRLASAWLLPLVLAAVMVLPGCISRSTYNRDMSKLLNKIDLDKQESEGIYDKLEAANDDRSFTLNKLTTRYMQLQKSHARLQKKFNNFDKDLNTFSHDIAELKLVITKNMDKIRSSMANEMLIKIIDMEFRIEELRKKETEELPQLPLNEQGQFDPAPEAPATK